MLDESQPLPVPVQSPFHSSGPQSAHLLQTNGQMSDETWGAAGGGGSGRQWAEGVDEMMKIPTAGGTYAAPQVGAAKRWHTSLSLLC